MKKQRRTKAARRRRVAPRKATTKRTRTPAARAAVLRTVLLGEPIELVYRHAHGGTYRHKFTKGTRISFTLDGKALVIDGSNVKAFIEG